MTGRRPNPANPVLFAARDMPTAQELEAAGQRIAALPRPPKPPSPPRPAQQPQAPHHPAHPNAPRQGAPDPVEELLGPDYRFDASQ